MKRLIIAGAALAMVLAMPTLAQARVGGQASGQIGVQGSANTNGPNATDRDFGNARAEDRMSAQGSLNTNGPNATDRDLGLARAEDRMSAQGLKHSKAKVHANASGDIDKN